MGKTAQAIMTNRPQGMSALAILDVICEPYRGCDAEFEAEDPNKPGCVHPNFGDWRDPHQNAALGMLMIEAFAPNGVSDLPRYNAMLEGANEASDDACDAWWDEVCTPFRARYDFC